MEFSISENLLYNLSVALSGCLSRLEVFIMSEKQKHLDLKSRFIIEHSLDSSLSFKAIALELQKDCTTISKEVRNHLVFKKIGSFGKPFNDCALRFECDVYHLCHSCTNRSGRPCKFCGKCIVSCSSYQKESCRKLSRPPYVCNGCAQKRNCTLEKRFYSASAAQKEYELTRSDSRSGFAISETELEHLDSVVSPLLLKGQSIHHIAQNHADSIMCSEKTLYTYIDNNLLTARNIDLPRKVRLRPRKAKPVPLKVDKACRIGRTWKDYCDYRSLHPDTPVVQIDSVEGIKGGKVLLTIHFVNSSLMLAFLRDSNDSQSVIDIFDRLYLQLRPDIFMDLFPVILADNGSEFSNPSRIEFDSQGNRRTHLFYCDPSAPYQKGAAENNHEFIRRIIPKGVDLALYTQDQISLMMSHINSYLRKALGNKSPYDTFAFQHGTEALEKFGLRNIPADEIILSPELFK